MRIACDAPAYFVHEVRRFALRELLHRAYDDAPAYFVHKVALRELLHRACDDAPAYFVHKVAGLLSASSCTGRAMTRRRTSCAKYGCVPGARSCEPCIRSRSLPPGPRRDALFVRIIRDDSLIQRSSALLRLSGSSPFPLPRPRRRRLCRCATWRVTINKKSARVEGGRSPIFFGGDVAGGADAVFAEAAVGEDGGQFEDHVGVAA